MFVGKYKCIYLNFYHCMKTRLLISPTGISKMLFVALLFQVIVAYAQIPAGYYDGASGLSGETLKSALHNIIDDHTTISYDDVKEALKTLDEDPDNNSNVFLLYKQVSTPKDNFGGGIDNWNREHLWPSSHGDFGTSAPEGTDLHHLRPTDVSVNSNRGDKDFDNGGSAHSEATSCYFTSDTWEPPTSVKGDIARAIFYMAVRYEGGIGEADLEIQDNYTSTSSNNGFLGKLTTLLQWHVADPVTDAERTRNNTIYDNYQNNRNPFIDHPEYVNLIWGTALADEPTNHVTDFSANTITLNWTDAVGEVLPGAYLIKMSAAGFDNITAPTDGTAENDSFWIKNVSYGLGEVVFSGLTPGTTYYFKMWGYTGSGASIDYKTDGDVLQTSILAP